MVLIKKCPNCGKDFETWKTNKKYCSKECYEYSNYKRKHMKDSLIKKCLYCGCEFKTIKKNQKYCSTECSIKAKQDQSNYKTKNNKKIPLGTIGELSAYNGDFEKEQKIIKYLKKRVGLS